MHIKKETFQEFELKRFVFDGEIPGAGKIEGQGEGAPEAAGEQLDNPDDLSNKRAEKEADQAKEKVDQDVDEKDVDPETGERIQGEAEKAANAIWENNPQLAHTMMQYMGKENLDQASFAEEVKTHPQFKKFVEGMKPNESGEYTVDEKTFATWFKKETGIEAAKLPNENEINALRKKVGDKFGEDALTLLSMQYEFGGKGRKLYVKQGDKDVEVTAELIPSLLPQDIREKYAAANAEGATDADKNAYGEALQSKLTEMNLALQTANAIEKGKMGKKESGIGRLFKIGMKLLELYNRAKATGDYSVLQEAISDAAEGKHDMAKRIENAEKTYKDAVDHIDDLGQLIKLHADPEGSRKAKELFEFGKSEPTPYRGLLKTPIEKKIEAGLSTGMKISKMESASNGTTIDVTRGNEKYMIDMNVEGGQIRASVAKLDKDGNILNSIDDQIIQSLNDPSKGLNLRGLLDQIKTSAPTTPETTTDDDADDKGAGKEDKNK